MAPDRADSPLWLSHHHPDEYERCVRIAGHHVCRRCAVLYPLVVVAAACASAFAVPADIAVAAMWLLPVPMSLDWVLEQRGAVSPSPHRLSAVSALAALGIGAAFATHLRHPFSPDALAPMATHFTACAVASISAARRRADAAASTDWEGRHARAEALRDAELRSLLARDDRESLRAE